MSEINLILLDLDGTLLLKDNIIPEELDEVIHKLNNKGVTLGIATGRYYGSVKKLFKNTYNEMAIVSGNGTSIYLNDNNIYFKAFEEDLYKKVLKDSLAINNPDILIQPMLDEFILSLKGDPINIIFEKFGMPIKEIDNFNQYTKDIIQMSLMSKSQKDYDYSKFYKDILDKCEIMPSGYGCLDIMPKGITKASGIINLAKYLNISTDQIMAIGDAMNDYDMLKAVGVPVAMKNGDQRLKDIAKYITTKTNSENGCMDFIINYFNLK